MSSEQITINSVEQSVSLTSKLADFLSELAKTINQSRRYDVATSSGMEAIIKEIREGRKPKTDIVDEQDEEVFRSLLELYHVPYAAISFWDADSGKNRVAFLTREFDAPAVEEIRERFLYEMNMGMSEIDVESFVRNNEGQNVMSYNNFNDCEIEVFRQYAATENVSFTVVNDKKHTGKYEIMFIGRDREGILRAIKNMSYDFSGEEGKKYKAKVQEGLDHKRAFDAAINPKNDETIFVVDSKEPRNFISVSKKGFILHSLENTTQTRYDGSKENIILDKNTIKFTSYDRDKLMKYVNNLKRPVVLTAEEMNIINGISTTGEAILPSYKEFQKKYETLQKNLAGRTDYYKGRVIKERLRGPEKIHTRINIPPEIQTTLMNTIRVNNLKETVIASGCIAYSEKDRPIIEKVIEAELYKGMDPLQKFEARVFYEGRGVLNVSDTNRVQYILNAKNPDYVLKLDDSGLTIFENGENVSVIPRDENFRHIVTELVKTMDNPVALSREEMETTNEKRMEHIMEHLSNDKSNPAVEHLRNVEKAEKEELHHATDKEEHMSYRQKEALDMVQKFETVEYHVDRNILEKITEMDFGKKTVTENHYHEETISH